MIYLYNIIMKFIVYSKINFLQQVINLVKNLFDNYKIKVKLIS